MAGTRPLSSNPDAVRQRRKRENDELVRKAAELAARITGTPVTPSSPSSPTSPPSSPRPANDNELPLHETKPVEGPGASAYAFVPVLPPTTQGGAPRPIVSAKAQAPIGPDGQPLPDEKPRVTPEEAKMFAKLVVGYFQFGSTMLFQKHPEFLEGLVGMSGGPEQFNAGFAFACNMVGQCSERNALKYNLRVPYVDEAVTIVAIGVATFGLAGKPSERGKAVLDEQARAQKAKNANTPPAPSPFANGTQAPAPAKPDEEELELD